MEAILKNLPNVIYRGSFMTVTTLLLKQIFIHRELDGNFRIEFECGSREYHAVPENVISALGSEDDILKVHMTFPTLNETILLYSGL